MGFKILHLADLHLDASFGGSHMTPSVARDRRFELRAALGRILARARDIGVDAITIAGDLYEHDRVTRDTANYLRSEFHKVAPVQVLIAPGNHDPRVPSSAYRQIEWPDNVFIFEAPILSPRTVAEGITVWGAAHNSPSFGENLLESFKPPRTGVNLVLLHGSDTSCLPEGKDAHCPFHPEQLRQSGVGFAMLGHYHAASMRPEEDPIYCYPGSPEPLGFDEEGPHYVLLLEIGDGTIFKELLQINQMEYRTIGVDVAGASSVDDIIRSVKQLASEQSLRSCFMRIELTGQLDPDVDLNLDALLQACHDDFAFLDFRDSTYSAYDYESLQADQTVKGAFVRHMLSKIERTASQEESRVLQDALTYGLQAFDRKEISPK